MKTVSYQTLNRIPFFLLTEKFLNIIHREGNIKLTPNGALQKKYLQELYDYRLFTEPLIESGAYKVTREKDLIAIHSMHINTQLSGFVRKINGKLTTTKKCKKLLQSDQRDKLFKVVLQTYIERFNWAYNDAYTEHPVGQLGWAFTVYLLNHFGDKPETIQFYADKYLKAFPVMLLHFKKPLFENSPESWFAKCYCTRTFERFLKWFGFVKAEPDYPVTGGSTVMKTQTFTDIFRFV
jgi:hypothetical protein